MNKICQQNNFTQNHVSENMHLYIGIFIIYIGIFIFYGYLELGFFLRLSTQYTSTCQNLDHLLFIKWGLLNAEWLVNLV